ncbi:MAG: substrate-binding domain-containing protein [Bacteroidetes bacterium]|nr:substrate-binding domain-containing protein [Bacteroidota bacterium]
MQYRPLYLIAIFCLSLMACGRHPDQASLPPAAMERPIHIDSITVYADEAFRYIVDQEVRVYENDQPDQHLQVIYLPEAEVLRHLYTDSFSTVVIGRRLRESERIQLFKKNHITPDESCFARDGIALVAHSTFPQDTLTYTLVGQLVAGRSDRYKLVFEGNGSGVLSYMFGLFSQSSRPSAFAVKNTNELVDYLQKDTKAIGFLPYDKISDEDVSDVRDLLKKVKLLYVAKADSTGRTIVSTASQSEIADESYPFARPINFIQHSMDQKVGTGFVNFLYKERSGRIILKSGLVPAIMPSRTININTDGLK